MISSDKKNIELTLCAKKPKIEVSNNPRILHNFAVIQVNFFRFPNVR